MANNATRELPTAGDFSPLGYVSWMMDYHAIHGHDIASFDTSGTHRLPTVAASQALQDLEDDSSTFIPTGLDKLDKTLLGFEAAGPDPSSARRGGLKRRQVTEVWGPPGSGKTALGVQLAANTVASGKGVIWIDCFQTVQKSRVSKVLKHIQLQNDTLGNDDVKPGKLTHYACLTLPHLMALISRPITKDSKSDVALIVIDSISALINSALPKSQDKPNSKQSNGPTPSTRRLQALQSISSALQKLSATRDCAILVLSQCATKMHAENSAAIVSAINARVWEQGISTRLVFFRDWMWHEDKTSSIFLAGLQKMDGKVLQDISEQVCAFMVEAGGMRQVQYQADHPLDLVVSVAPQKRKRGEDDAEVPDSEDDEDYGWAEEDEADLPPPPPQWQGSEDIILGQELGHSEDEYTDNEGKDEEDHESAGEQQSQDE